jgi:hypothetical protein
VALHLYVRHMRSQWWTDIGMSIWRLPLRISLTRPLVLDHSYSRLRLQRGEDDSARNSRSRVSTSRDPRGVGRYISKEAISREYHDRCLDHWSGRDLDGKAGSCVVSLDKTCWALACHDGCSGLSPPAFACLKQRYRLYC